MKRFLLVSAVVVFVIVAGCTSVTQSTGKTTLQFTTSPSGAEVYLDNQYSGTTPCSLSDVSVGSHTLEYRLTGYSPWKSSITVPAGTSSYFATLTPLASQTATTRPIGHCDNCPAHLRGSPAAHGNDYGEHRHPRYRG